MDTIDTTELVGQVIDIFEDFLQKKGEIKIPDDDEAIIKNKDYDELASSITSTLINWGLIRD